MDDKVLQVLEKISQLGFVELIKVSTESEICGTTGEFYVFMHEKGVLINVDTYGKSQYSKLSFNYVKIFVNTLENLPECEARSICGDKVKVVQKISNVEDTLKLFLSHATGRPIRLWAQVVNSHERVPEMTGPEFSKLNMERLKTFPEWVQKLIIIKD
jgi:hypothetical protein